MNPFHFLMWPMFQQAMLQYCVQTTILSTRVFLPSMAKALVPSFGPKTVLHSKKN